MTKDSNGSKVDENKALILYLTQRHSIETHGQLNRSVLVLRVDQFVQYDGQYNRDKLWCSSRRSVV